jgi:hypothetical protein
MESRLTFRAAEISAVAGRSCMSTMAVAARAGDIPLQP